MNTSISIFFFFNDTATTEIYTLSLHDALPISWWASSGIMDGPERTRLPLPGAPQDVHRADQVILPQGKRHDTRDRKSTRLNSSHANISYAVFCLKKKKKR